ncbi:RrF2 family transcriptional regulator [Azohydromonas caseinilytica]|uniref:Rrf2 family transcriptional regulator n=1 Tax=Azohydromonas caseinilytica TaxID=2728836 RepID=A0A848F8X7_9BURK|nr:Rrf2 family transcriptional regulator [Azohydromonas caseinilytica]NML15246.1 Rrf2 family transcriptional regulator [Azohydromonas caseinilytica]
MRLTAMTDYALRLLMHVGQHPQRLCTIAEVARAYGISEAHLMKVTHRLALGGWLETVRGKGGGMRLALPAEQIHLGAVVRCMEPDFALVECLAVGGHDCGCDDTAPPPAGGCALDGQCALTGVIGGALQRFMQHLDAHTLADVLPGAPQPVRLLRPAALPTAAA